MLGCRPIQIMAVEWIPPQGDHSGGKMSPKANDRDKTNKDVSLDFLPDDPEWKFIYNIEIWHKRSVPRGQKKVSIAFPESSGVRSDLKNETPSVVTKSSASAIIDPYSSPQPTPKLRIEIDGGESGNSSPSRTPRLTPRPSSAPSYRTPTPTAVSKDDTKIAHRAFNIVGKLRSGSGDAVAGSGGGGGLVQWRSSSCIPHTPDKTLSTATAGISLPPTDSGRNAIPNVPARKFQLPMFRSQTTPSLSPKSSEL